MFLTKKYPYENTKAGRMGRETPSTNRETESSGTME
jgi:hypothetical protein